MKVLPTIALIFLCLTSYAQEKTYPKAKFTPLLKDTTLWKLSSFDTTEFRARKKLLPDYIPENLIGETQYVRNENPRSRYFYKSDEDRLKADRRCYFAISEYFHKSGNPGSIYFKSYSTGILASDSVHHYYDTTALIIASKEYNISKYLVHHNYYDKEGRLFESFDFKTSHIKGGYHGKYLSYHENGQLHQDINYEFNKKHGLYKEYNDNGVLAVAIEFGQGNMKNFLECNDYTGKPLDVGSFKDGNGILKMYYDSGALYMIKEFKDGLLWNVLKTYSQNGEELEIGTFKNGTGKLNKYGYDKPNLLGRDVYKKGQYKKFIPI